MNQTITKLRAMRLHAMAQVHSQRSEQNLYTDHTVDQYTTLLVDQEWEDRQTRKMKRLIQGAKFKATATISDIDYTTQRGLDQDLLSRLCILKFIKEHENIILTGPSGVGKSFIAQALGHQACMHGIKTLYQNTNRFLAILKYAKMENNYLKQLHKMSTYQLLILDDFGLQQMDNAHRDILMDIIEQRHNHSATIIASQIPVSKWYDIIGEGTVADAILDRIVHTAHHLSLNGESMRKRKSIRNKNKSVD